MKRKYKIPLYVLLLLILIIGGLFILSYFNKGDNTNVKIVDTIDNFSYTLDERDTKLMKNIYNDLKKTLKEKDINYEEYAKNLAKLFVIDLFTLDNKINKYDVGSIEYVYPDAKDNFIINVEDTIYRHILNNSNGKRKQKLPVVSDVSIENIEEKEYTYGDATLEGYLVSLKWDYEVDLGYDKEATINIVKKDNMLYVAEYVVGESHE